MERDCLGDCILTPLAIVPEFDCYGEISDGRVWIHHRVYRWSPRVLREVKKTLADIQANLNSALWVLDNDPETTPLLFKYLTILNFKPCEFIVNDGRIRTAFVKRLHG